jgi:hypothetical protein
MLGPNVGVPDGGGSRSLGGVAGTAETGAGVRRAVAVGAVCGMEEGAVVRDVIVPGAACGSDAAAGGREGAREKEDDCGSDATGWERIGAGMLGTAIPG